MNPNINLTAIYIADGFGAFLAVIMLGARMWRNVRIRSEGKLIRLMLYTSLISCIADTITFVCDGNPGTGAFLFAYIGNLWLYVSDLIMGTLWVMLFISHITGKRMSKPHIILTAALNALGTAALIVNFFVPVVFSVSPENIYSRGILFWMYTAIEVIITADGVITYSVLKHKSSKSEYFPVWQFVIPILIGIIIQSAAYGISTIWPAITIAICGIILGLYNEGEAEAEALRQHEIDSKIILEQQKNLSEALKAAEAANRAKTEFLFNMSHDIRTPMNAILGYADIALRHEDDAERVKDSLGKIKTSGGHLLSLINDILEMSRIESGKLVLAENPMDIRDAINSVSQMSQALAVSKDIDFSTIIGEIKNPYILADELHVNEVLINLISNAVKYNREGGKVEYRTEQIGDAKDGTALFRFTVKDNGIGISEDFKEHLFEDFTRENSSTVSKQEGAGLGLSIVKKIVDLAGGTVGVQSVKGEGSTFTVELPMKVMDETAERIYKAAQSKYTVLKSDSAFEGRRVLLAEDNEMNREIATEILQESGLKVSTAEDGAAAVKAVAEKGADYFDYILMDIQMPVMDGYTATAEIRRLPDGDRVPIIALSANAFREDMEKSIAAGMNAHVAKPINISTLLATMHSLSRQK